MRIGIFLPVICGLVILGTDGSALLAQSPAFEVASLKVNRTDNGSSSGPRLTNGRLTAENVTLRTMLRVAYGLTGPQITGPGWLDSDRFDVAANSPQDVPESDLKSMLQSLLKERFLLAVHIETKNISVYDLIVSKGGLKISVYDPAHPLQTPPRNGAASMIIGVLTMPQLADMLVSPAGRPVLNKTGLQGRYGCALLFSPLSPQAGDRAGDSTSPDIFAAVHQRGSQLESTKEPLDILIVDYAERVPTEN